MSLPLSSPDQVRLQPVAMFLDPGHRPRWSTYIQKDLQRNWPKEHFFLENYLTILNYITINSKVQCNHHLQSILQFIESFHIHYHWFIYFEVHVLKSREKCQRINRGGMKVAYVHANLMSPRAVKASVPVSGKTSLSGSAYHLLLALSKKAGLGEVALGLSTQGRRYKVTQHRDQQYTIYFFISKYLWVPITCQRLF